VFRYIKYYSVDTSVLSSKLSYRSVSKITMDRVLFNCHITERYDIFEWSDWCQYYTEVTILKSNEKKLRVFLELSHGIWINTEQIR